MHISRRFMKYFLQYTFRVTMKTANKADGGELYRHHAHALSTNVEHKSMSSDMLTL